VLNEWLNPSEDSSEDEKETVSTTDLKSTPVANNTTEAFDELFNS